jgi:hypothetical protein
MIYVIGNIGICLAGLWVVICRANLMSKESTKLHVRIIYTCAAALFVGSMLSPLGGDLIFLVTACASTSTLILMLLEDWLHGPPSYTCK